MKAFFCIALVLALVQSTFAFMPVTPVRRTQMRMAAQQQPKIVTKAKSVMAGLTPVIMSAPVWATEGTGEAFGVDDSRILPIVAAIGAAFAFLFSTWSNAQDNEEFFSGYQKTERK